MKTRKLLFVLMILFLGACAARSKNESTLMTNDSYQLFDRYGGVAPTENISPGITKQEATFTMGEKIIHTIGLELETKQYTDTIERIETLTKTLNGYVQSSTIPRNPSEEKYQGLTAHYSLMIPTDKIDEFIVSTGEISNIVNESRNALNITENYNDTESRIKNLTTKESRLLELLKESGTLADLLQIETELSNTRYEIEQLETTLRGYDNRIAYTQFNISIREVYTYTPAKRDSVWERITDEFNNNLQGFVRSVENMFIFLVSTLPFLLVQLIFVAVPLLIIYAVYRKLGHRKPRFKHKADKSGIVDTKIDTTRKED